MRQECVLSFSTVCALQSSRPNITLNMVVTQWFCSSSYICFSVTRVINTSLKNYKQFLSSIIFSSLKLTAYFSASWSDSSHSHTGSGRQFLPGRKLADIEYNSCYLQSKTLSSYNHKATQVVCYFFNLILGYVQYSAKITIVPISTSLFALLIFLILPINFIAFIDILTWDGEID